MSKYSTIAFKLLLASIVASLEIHAMEKGPTLVKSMTQEEGADFVKELKKLYESYKNSNKESPEGKKLKAQIISEINLKMQTGEFPTQKEPWANKDVLQHVTYLLKFLLGNSEKVPTKEQDPTDLFNRVIKYYEGKSGQHWNQDEIAKFEPLEPSFRSLQVQPSKTGNLQQVSTFGKSMTQEQGEQFVSQLKDLYESYNQNRESSEGKKFKAQIISLINSKMQTGEFPTQKDEWGKGVLQHVTYLLKFLFTNRDEVPKKNQDPTDLFSRVIKYYEGKQGQHWSQDEIDQASNPSSGGQALQPQPKIESPIIQNKDGSSSVLSIETTQQTLSALINPNTGGGKISNNSHVMAFGKQAAQQALDALNLNDCSLILVKNQGYNSVTFNVQNKDNKFVYVVKVARGEGELKKLLELRDIFVNKLKIDISSPNDILQKRGLIGISIPLNSFTLSVNDINLPNYSIQIMNYIKSDADFGIIVKRLLGGGNKYWVETVPDKWQDSAFDQSKDLNLMASFGKAFGKFQRGGKATDNQISNMTLVHGDLFLDHVLVTDYKLDNTTMQNIDPKFSLIDIGTMEYVSDPQCYMLLVDPMFFSSIVFVDFRKKNFRQGTLDLFNNFYLGYVGEFSEQTLNKLVEMYKDPGSAYQSFLQAAKYAKSIDREMKTAQNEHFKLSSDDHIKLEKQLANLHRLSFLYAYYKVIKGDEKAATNILNEQQQWKDAWKSSGLELESEK